MPAVPDQATGGPMDEEPIAMLTAALIVVVNAGLILANAMEWVNLTQEQIAGLIAFVSATCAFIGVFMRLKVYSPATVRRLAIGAA